MRAVRRFAGVAHSDEGINVLVGLRYPSQYSGKRERSVVSE